MFDQKLSYTVAELVLSRSELTGIMQFCAYEVLEFAHSFANFSNKTAEEMKRDGSLASALEKFIAFKKLQKKGVPHKEAFSFYFGDDAPDRQKN